MKMFTRSKSNAGEANGKPKKRSSIFGGFSSSEKKATPPSTSEVPDAEPKPGALTRAASSFLPDHNSHRPDVESIFTQFSEVMHATLKPVTSSADGQHHDPKKEKSSMWEDLKTFGITDYKTLTEVIKQKATGALIDDKTYMMERIIQLVADLPAGSQNRINLTNDFIDQLWNSLQHPPLTYLGDKYTWRQPDGSYNNIQYPHLGQAGQPYARSVRPMQMRQGAMPDAGLIFDSVMARYDFKPHPNNVSSMLFYVASIIIHDIFRTDFRNHDYSSTSSYLDLAPLYGSSEEELSLVRSFKDGKLKPDAFSERRLLGFPPGVSCLLIMFNRFHNYVAETIAQINEGGRFNLPMGRENDPEAQKKRENDIFQTARLVTSGLYINIILTDYLRTIVNLNRVNSTWTLDPRANMEKAFGDDGTPRGVGNQVPVEFNLVYRWHSSISKRDEEWTEEFYKKIFQGMDPHKVDWKTLLMGLGRWEHSIPQDPAERTFNDLKRRPDGKFEDDDLVKILRESIEDCSGNFGANNVPIIMKAVEILGIEQARKWKCASLNEFRNFFGLASHKTFEDINPDPKVAENLRRLYDHPDFVELYPGIVSEAAKTPMVPGVGICPTFTISRAILSDAVTLVRGDRFYTVDYTPANLTNWGYSEVACDFNINQGCVFHKLFLKAFPNHFKHNSIYAFYPLTIPKENHKIMTDLGRVNDFDFDPPERLPRKVHVSSYAAYKTVQNNQNVFKPTWGKAFDHILGGHTWSLSGETEENARQKSQMQAALYPEGWRKQVFEFYEFITTKLLKENAYEIANTHMVDAVRDVINIAHAHYAATTFALPIKTADHPRGVYSEQELYLLLAVVYTFTYSDNEPTKSFALHKAAKQVTAQLQKLVQANITAINRTNFMKNIMNSAEDSHTPLRNSGIHTIRRLLDAGKTPEQIAWEIVPTAAAMVGNQAQVFSQILDLYLSDDYKHHLTEIHALSKLNTEEANTKLRRYVLEGARIAGSAGIVREAATNFDIQDGSESHSLNKGDVVFVNCMNAGRDESKFPDPLAVNLTRSEEDYIQLGDGTHECLGSDASIVGLTAMLKVFGRLDNLRRAPGLSGHLKSLPREGGFKTYMKEDWSATWPFPTTMKIQFDGGL